MITIALTMTHIATSSPAQDRLARPAEFSAPLRVQVDVGDRGMVVSDSPAASRIGRDILAQGGSAVDAAVATAMAMAVSWPDAGNIGGGGFMLVRPGNGHDPVCVDYRETAPMVMHATSFSKDDTTYAHKAVGVPGTVRGLAAAHQRYGRLPWSDLVMPAARLASDGVPVDEPLADSLNSVLSEQRVIQDHRFAELRRVYGHPDKRPWQPGDRLLLPELARTLTTIAQQGPDAFYRGPIADALVGEMQRGDGLISHADLQSYQARIRPVIRGQYRGYTILGAPPPSSGGISIVQALNILENFELSSRDRFDPITIHLIAEASRRAFADRARFLGDPDFAPIPTWLTEKDYAKQLAATIELERATPSGVIADEIMSAGESPDTTHFSVVDADGMAVSNTYTLEASWGSRLVVKGAGFVLNNEMGDFNWFPGETNTQGRIGTPANTVAGGKRMLSSQSPTIVEKDGQLVLVTGSPGGRTIISTVLGTLINYIDFNQSPALAVESARMHHQWFPDQIDLEQIDQVPHASVVQQLTAMGHATRGRASQGSAHSIAVDLHSKTLIGVADFRRGGRPASLRTDSLARWDFSEPAGIPLTQLPSRGRFTLNWSSSLSGIESDGRDHLRIRSPAGVTPLVSTVTLPSSPMPLAPGIWSIEIKIASAVIAGDQRNEQVVFALANGSDADSIVASVGIGRPSSDTVSLFATTNQEALEPIPISARPTITRPLVIKLSLDPVEQVVQVATRYASDEAFQVHRSAKVHPNSAPDRFQIATKNDLSNEGEFVNIDRIEILKRASSEKMPLE